MIISSNLYFELLKDGLLFQLGGEWDQKRIEIWYRKRRNINAQAIVPKFCETFWRFTFYLFIYIVGSAVVYGSECFWDNYKCWESYPRQTLDFSMKFYYFAELSFYLSLLLTIFTDTKRKDFVEQVVHHFATILLISLSYCVGYFRIGVLIMWLHDISDVFLESAKLCIYAKKTQLADILFGIFAISFMFGRIIYFPFWIIHTTLFKPWSINDFELFPGYYVFNGLLFILLGLHIFWFYLIVDMAVKMVKGSDINDSRSENEDEDDEESKNK